MYVPFKRRIAICLLLIFSLALVAAAQTPSPVPILLTDGEPARGILRQDDLPLVYTIPLPRGQDVWVQIESSAVIGLDYCMKYVVTPGSGGAACTSPGGGGSRAVSPGYLFTSANQPDRQETVEFTLRDPALAEARFTITAYVVTPQPVAIGQRGAAQASRPVQIYTLEAEDMTVFTVQVEDPQPDGAFLWATHQYYALPADTRRSDLPLDLPQWIDGAALPENADGITQLDLFYTGANTYRVVVEAAASYNLNINSVMALPLAIGESLGIPVSWQQPLFYVPLAIGSPYPRENQIRLNAELLEGSSVIVTLWTGGSSYLGESLYLGETRTGSGSGSLTQSVGGGLWVTISIPPDFNRSDVQVLISWERADS